MRICAWRLRAEGREGRGTDEGNALAERGGEEVGLGLGDSGGGACWAGQLKAKV